MSELIQRIESDLATAIQEIQKPRTDFQLEHFVVGQHCRQPQQWAQCVLEMQVKLFALKHAEITGRKTKRKIAMLEAKGRGEPFDLEAKRRADALDDADMARLDLMQTELAALGATRELETLDRIRQSFGKSFTREELEADQSAYWNERLRRQAERDIAATGRIGVGNQEALEQIGQPIGVARDAIQDVERRFLESARQRILIVVPTLIPREKIEADGLSCLDGWAVPATFEQKQYIVTGRKIADAYTDAVLTAADDGAEFILTVEDDHVIPPGTFERLWQVWRERGPEAIVGAWYPQKKEPRTGAPIVLRDGCRDYLDDDGDVHEVFAIPQGFTLIPTAIFRRLPRPWFVTTDTLTQDSFFSQLARDAGWKLFVDTGARIKHVCRETGRVYE